MYSEGEFFSTYDLGLNLPTLHGPILHAQEKKSTPNQLKLWWWPWMEGNFPIWNLFGYPHAPQASTSAFSDSRFTILRPVAQRFRIHTRLLTIVAITMRLGHEPIYGTKKVIWWTKDRYSNENGKVFFPRCLWRGSICSLFMIHWNSSKRNC